MFAHKLKFILLPELIATLNEYAWLLPPLANVNWFVFPECFWQATQMHNWWNGAKGSLHFGCRDLIWLALSVHICLGLIVEYWAFVGACAHHSYSKFFYLCLFSTFIKAFSTTHPSTMRLPLTSFYTLVHWSNIIEFHKKSSKTSEYKPLSTCQCSGTKANG